MAKFLSSDKVKVFPTAFRGKDANDKAIDPNAFLTTEENIVNITNKVLYRGKNYFFADGNTIHLILGGYYFVFSKADVTSQFTSSIGSVIYAGINVDNLTTSYESYQAKTLTPNGGSAGDVLDVTTGDAQEFKGLSFVTGDDATEFTYKLALFEYASAWLNVTSSMLNISTEQIRDGADGTNSIAQTFTTNKLNVWDVLPLSSSGMSSVTRVGTSSAYFSDAYVTNIHASTIYDVRNIDTQNSSLSVSATNFNLNVGNVVSIATSGIMNMSALASMNLSATTFNLSAGAINERATTIDLGTATYNLTAPSGITMSTAKDINLSANSNFITLTSSGHLGVSASQYMHFNAYDIAMTLGAKSIIFNLSNTNFGIDFASASSGEINVWNIGSASTLRLSGFSNVKINDYQVRPYEHKMVISLRSDNVPVAMICANPRLATSSIISTKTALVSALYDAGYLASMHMSNVYLFSPAVANGKYWSVTSSYISTIGTILGIGAGGTSTSKKFYVYTDNITEPCVDLHSFTFDIRDSI